MFPMTISIHNPAQLSAVLAALSLNVSASVAEPTTEQLIQIAKDRAVKADAPAWPTFEQAEANQKAEKEAAAAPTAAPGKPTRTSANPAASPARSQPTAEVAVADAPAPSTAQPEPQSATAPAATATSAPEPITYDKVASAITSMVKVNREHAVDTLAAFGVRKGPELKPEQYAAFLAALNEPEAVPA